MRRVDILISGGGMVGLPLGLALAQGGLDTVIVDAAAPAQVLDPKFDGRVSALAYASVRMLIALGVWDRLAPDAQPIREILVTDGKAGRPASPFSLHFDAEEVGADSLGHIAENRHIRTSLRCRRDAAVQSGIAGAAECEIADGGGGPCRGAAADGRKFPPPGDAADGRDRRCRVPDGVQVIGWSYPQTGIVATVEHEKPHNGVAYEHFRRRVRLRSCP